MSNEALEELVEEIMRLNGYNSYEDYIDEALRTKFRNILLGVNEDAGSENVQQL